MLAPRARSRCIPIAFVWLLVRADALRAGVGDEAACTVSSKAGERCVVDVKALHPTQLAIGTRAVERRARDIVEKTPDQRDRLLREKRVPIVVAPGGKLYLVDRHHLVRALMLDSIDRTYATVKANLSSSDDFWGTMTRNGWVLLCDENGRGPRGPSALPESIADLKDDPYRSLAASVQDEGGFAKPKHDVLFLEFWWANFFRSRVEIGSDFEAAISKAKELALSPEACGLPGYKGSKTGCEPTARRCLP